MCQIIAFFNTVLIHKCNKKVLQPQHEVGKRNILVFYTSGIPRFLSPEKKSEILSEDLQGIAAVGCVERIIRVFEYTSNGQVLAPTLNVAHRKILMLEAMTQVGAWLVRASEDFQHSMVVLKEARNVKYGQFVEPGQTLHVAAEIVKQSDTETVLKAQGTVDGQSTVKGRLILERYNLADTNPARAETDEVVRRQMRELFDLLWRPEGQPAESSK